jgi:hypothetical protein
MPLRQKQITTMAFRKITAAVDSNGYFTDEKKKKTFDNVGNAQS